MSTLQTGQPKSLPAVSWCLGVNSEQVVCMVSGAVRWSYDDIDARLDVELIRDLAVVLVLAASMCQLQRRLVEVFCSQVVRWLVTFQLQKHITVDVFHIQLYDILRDDRLSLAASMHYHQHPQSRHWLPPPTRYVFVALSYALLTDISFDEYSTEKKFHSLKVNKSPGTDQLHSRLLKEMSGILKYLLQKLFSLCMDKGKIPDTWKIGHVTPVFKKGKSVIHWTIGQ